LAFFPLAKEFKLLSITIMTMFKILKCTGLLVTLFLFGACDEKTNSNNDYTELSEVEKRKPENALVSMNVAEGLQLELFASEPMVTNPTNMAVDAKGRIWVCEGRNYRLFANPDNTYDNAGDRILILEDTDGDGKADTSKVFYQGEDINAALGIAVLGDKVYVSVSPNVFVFTDADGDDVPDSKEVLFSGIEGEDHDHGVHAFVFGPDGRLYFNYGNNGKQLLDKDGNTIKDKYGNVIKSDGNPYREGMAFRMEMDGSNVEVLGHNFRNPYELAVDSYGGLWQSDNDDDGNRGARINYLMEYGSYGFKDRLTGSDWRERRPGWSDEIPKRHWHLNDPGTVPNVLQTGSGSPTGILVYEDKLLPERFQNQLIHCEPGHNVVRSYILEDKEAGYSAKIENLVKSDDDWFRPSDVTVATDGSLFISDWYDGGVGGHKAADIAQGRIYHLSTKTGYKPTKFDFNTAKGAVAGLQSDNMDVLFQSWRKLHALGDVAIPHLETLMEKGGTTKARALWLAAKVPSRSRTYIETALADEDPKFRMQGLRMARYLDVAHLEEYVALVVNDASIQVRREAAIALRHIGTQKAAQLWAELVNQHYDTNRWYLEALGIGADKHADLYFNTWKTSVGDDWKNPAGKEIVWRIPAEASVPMLLSLIKDENVEVANLPSYFRALSFKKHLQKNDLVADLLRAKHPLENQIYALAIGQLDVGYVKESPRHIQKIKNILPNIEGSPEWILALKKLELTGQNEALFRVISKEDIDADIQKEAASLLFKSNGADLIASKMSSDAPELDKMNLIGLIGNINDSVAVDILLRNMNKEGLSFPIRRKSVEALGNTWDGRHRLFDILKAGKIPEELKTTAVLKLMNSWDSEITKNLPKYMDENTTENLDIDALVEREGNNAHGKELYATYCASCHVAGNEGVEFGPALSDIGNKLSKRFLYSNIVNPSSGISFGYEGYTVQLKNGKSYTGYILSQTEDELTIKMIGGTQEQLELANVEKLEAMQNSLMTEGLHKVMSEEDLVDLVEYLTTLKVGEEEVVAVN
jgi:putative membrane-bound dehydrogenase-like protein